MMVDPENLVFTRIAQKLRYEYPKINITGEYVNEPSSFPHVSIIMTDNTTIKNSLDGSSDYEAAAVRFEINVYSNLQSGRKAQAKAIANIIDKEFMDMNFIRVALLPMPNLAESGIYRITGRYSGCCDGETFYRR